MSAAYFRVLGVSPFDGSRLPGGRTTGSVVPTWCSSAIDSGSGALAETARFLLVNRSGSITGLFFTVIGVMPCFFRKCAGACGGTLGAPAVRSIAAGRGQGMGTSLADGGTPGRGRERQSGRYGIQRDTAPIFPALREGICVLLAARRIRNDGEANRTRSTSLAVQAVATGHSRRRGSGAAEGVRERDEFDAGAGRAAEQRIRPACRAGRRTDAFDPATPGREFPSGRLAAASSGDGDRVEVCEGASVALSPPGLPRIGAIQRTAIARVRGGIRNHLAGGPDCGSGTRATGVTERPAQRVCIKARGHTAGGHQLTRRMLVITEVALALMLLVGAGLLLRSLGNLFATDPGFEERSSVDDASTGVRPPIQQ